MNYVKMKARRLVRFNIVVGLLGWLVVLTLRPVVAAPFASPLPLLLLFAVLVITPLALNLVGSPDQDNYVSMLHAFVVAGQLPAGLLAIAAIWQAPGFVAAAFAVPWILLTFLLAAYGLLRFLRLPRRIEEIVIDFGLMYTAVGGVWWLASRAGTGLLGFTEPLVTLTAIHFHYISLAALVLTGLLGRRLRQLSSPAVPLYRMATAGMIVGPPLVALGITFSVLLEAVAAVLLTLSLATIALISLVKVVPGVGVRAAGVLLTLSSGAVLFAMFFASAYALGRLSGLWAIPIPTMIQVHGWVNAFGFAFCGLLAYSRLASGVPLMDLEPLSHQA